MPTRPDRNLAIERLLREGHAAPAEAEAGACVAAEELAAWVDGGLPAADAARVESHLAACPTCQALLAAFARTEPVATAAPSRGPTRVLLPLAAAAVLVVGVWLAGTRPERTPASVPAERQMARVEPPPATTSVRPPQPAAGDAARRSDDRQSQRLPDRSAVSRSEQSEPQAVVEGLPQGAAAAPPAPAPVSQAAAPEVAAAPKEGAEQDAQRSRLARLANARFSSVGDADTPLPLASPDGASRWRLAGRALEVSADGGATWLPAIGVTPADLVDVVSGASPTRGVSWLVGRGGLVLVTTDGRRFTRASTPAPVLLTRVEPEDGAIATVRASDGRAWRTADAGRTWVPIQ